jgi:hypothetical protein
MGTEVSFARGMRVKWRRVRVESTRAMLKSVWREGGLVVWCGCFMCELSVLGSDEGEGCWD